MSHEEILKELRTVKKILLDTKHSLDEINALIKLIYRNRLQEIKNQLLKEGSVKRRIYELCDGTRTSRDIAETIGKSTEYVNSYLSILRREGFIRSVERAGKLVHEQVF